MRRDLWDHETEKRIRVRLVLRILAPGFGGFPDNDGGEAGAVIVEAGAEHAVDGGGDVFDAGDEILELRNLDVEVFVVEAVDDGFGDDALESGDIDEHAVAAGLAAEGDLELVVVAVAM